MPDEPLSEAELEQILQKIRTERPIVQANRRRWRLATDVVFLLILSVLNLLLVSFTIYVFATCCRLRPPTTPIIINEEILRMMHPPGSSDR